MNRKILLMAALMSCFAATAFAQVEATEEEYVDESVNVTSVADIINQQQGVNHLENTENHFRKVWGRNVFFDVAYNNVTLKPGTFPGECDEALPANYKSAWGAALKWGHSYRLHKKPIMNVARFNLDYIGMDFYAAKYDIEGGTLGNYTAKDGKVYEMLPWNNEKYNLSYGMAIGPSLTLAPFTLIPDQKQLHHLKFNVYYHLGYQADLLFMNSEEKNLKDAKLVWGHGLTSAIGCSINWRLIGFGFEHRTSSSKYRSIQTDDYSADKFKFDNSTNSIFLQFRY